MCLGPEKEQREVSLPLLKSVAFDHTAGTNKPFLNKILHRYDCIFDDYGFTWLQIPSEPFFSVA